MSEPLHGNTSREIIVREDGQVVQNLSVEEYNQTYEGTLHEPPGDVQRQIERAARGKEPRFLQAGIAPLVWMPAYSYGSAFTAGRPIGVTIHSTETDNLPGSAEALMGPNWFGGPRAGTSTHKCVDQNSIAEGVRRNTVAWHCGPNGNGLYIAYEFCGKATWTAEQWRTPAVLSTLAIAAPHIANDLAFCGAPARWLSLTEVAKKERGLLTHNDVKLALGGTTHWDPGPNFPYAELLAVVRDGTPLPTPAPTPTRPGPDSLPTLQYGQRSEEVRHLQEFMTKAFAGYNKYTPTGYYGDSTKAGVAEFQRRVGITGPDANGEIVGPRTKVQLWNFGYRG
ncbi:MAG TPA: N-acetylmuramoyl-L-alanine amidase [Candidatus Acidoferrum sp.]|nr:N-acetylmuramoyl-L-alanine amidase [Candidatus Acidoferrum sp.]